MSLDFDLKVTQPVSVFSANITHNLGKMADKAGIYKALWRPKESGYEKARDVIPVLEKGLAKLKANPAKYEQYNSPDGWGTYKHFVPFVEEVLDACYANPDADIEVSV